MKSLNEALQPYCVVYVKDQDGDIWLLRMGNSEVVPTMLSMATFVHGVGPEEMELLRNLLKDKWFVDNPHFNKATLSFSIVSHMITTLN